MDERLREIFPDEDAWIVGGAVRDELLLRPVLDLDVACSDPRAAAHRFADRFGGSVFPLSRRHGAWRVVADDMVETVDFTPVGSGIDADLASRDFTFNAIAKSVATGGTHDPHDGEADLRAGIVRGVSERVFVDDPLRLLRAVRFEDELDFRLDGWTETLLRESAALAVEPAGERVLAELARLSADGYRRLSEVGVLAPLGGSLDARLDACDDPSFRLVAVFGPNLRRLPISNELKRYAAALGRARKPEDPSPRSIHRFRRATEPWAIDALAYVGSMELVGLVEAARRSEPSEPLVRGDELGVEPGPIVGRILDAIDEERAAGTISTREEALALARELAVEESA
jgi:tRNA nucleotidyltransferase/poly(A) polymerase